jgi:hypothetical protein
MPAQQGLFPARFQNDLIHGKSKSLALPGTQGFEGFRFARG